MILTEENFNKVSKLFKDAGSVWAVLHLRILDDPKGRVIHVQEFLTDEVNVWYGDAIGNPLGGGFERYADIGEFNAAYEKAYKTPVQL